MLIGIGGVSRSGKSTLAEQLFAEATQQKRQACILHQDTFVLSAEKLPRIRDHIDWEVPGSMDWKRLEGRVRAACAKNDIVILEGLFAFAYEAINRQYQRSICMHISRSVFWQRKSTDLRWGREPDWYMEHIWQSFLRYGQPPAHLYPITHIDGTVPVPVGIVRALLR